MLTNRHLIDSKWIFKNKIDGWFRSRLVARGYTQIPGLYFTNNYSSVVTEVTVTKYEVDQKEIAYLD